MAYYQGQKEFEEKIVETKRVSKKTKGGNKIGFTALVVVGNKKGKVGSGLGKATDISIAIQKGIKLAKQNAIDVVIQENGSIAHEITKKYKSSKVMLMPAPKGTGLIAGGAVRQVLELAGFSNVSAKLLGSSNKTCTVRCTIDALQSLKTEKTN